MNERVLIVEDDRRIAEAIGIRLRASGYRTSHARDVAEAVDRVLDERPDVALMDINLPDGNGVSLAARMRLLRATLDVPVVFVTASRDPAHRERAAALGIPLLEKPLPSATLLEAVAEALARRAEPAAPPSALAA